MLILDLWSIGFHAVVVFGLGKDFLFKSILGPWLWVKNVEVPEFFKRNLLSTEVVWLGLLTRLGKLS